MVDLPDGTPFVLKNITAEETSLAIGEGMRTVGDLRSFVEERFDVPRCLQRFVGNGRVIDSDYSDSCSLDVGFQRQDCLEEGQENLIWIIWARDSDYAAVRRGGIFLESDLDAKRTKFEALEKVPFSFVRLGDYKALCNRGIHMYRKYKGDFDDEEED